MSQPLIQQAASVYNLLERPPLVEKRAGLEAPSFTYVRQSGFHIYGELRLNLLLTAAEDGASARRYLKTIQIYVEIAERCAEVAGAVLLEVQGEVIHLLLPTDDESPDSVNRLLAFCVTFANIVYREIEPLAGDAWRSFAMATEHGPAVLISDGNNSSGSIVSLGPAANNPAKVMPHTPAGNLSIRPDTLGLVYPKVDRRKSWERFDLRNPPYQPSMQKVAMAESFVLNDAAMSTFARQIVESRVQYQATIRNFTAAGIKSGETVDTASPVQVQGFYMRADLDGFTADIKEAFDDPTGEKVREIVARFTAFMAFADAFSCTLDRQAIKLPWAGDCANIILLPRTGRSYSLERGAVPATEPAKWHDLTAGQDIQGKRWRDYMLKSEWAVAVAGGDDKDEGANGFLLVAGVVARERRFLIAAGWGAGRSKDALEVNGISGKDTVIHKVDFASLSGHFQQWFHPLVEGGIYYRASELGMRKLTSEAVKNEAISGPTVVPSVNIQIPRERPYIKG